MTLLGCVLDALNPAAAPDPATYPFKAARLVAFNDPRFYAYAEALDAADVQLALVLARETFGDGDRAAVCTAIAEHIAPALFIVGNEEDVGLLAEPSPSSWSMTPVEYADLWHTCTTAIRAVQPGAQFVVGGLVSGQPSALLDYAPLHELTSFDIHCYSKDAAQSADLLGAYGAELSSREDLLVLEFNREAAEIPEYVQMLAAQGITMACFYAWADNQMAGAALMDAAGNPTDRYAALLAAAQPPAQGGTTMASFQLGFAAYAAAHPEVGTPLEDEGPIGDVQLTTTGVLLYFPRANTVRFVPFPAAAS